MQHICKDFIADVKAAKLHEITHRVLQFHDIDEIDIDDTNGKEQTLSQECLAEIADRVTYPRQRDAQDRERYVTVPIQETTAMFSIKEIEQHLSVLIP